MKEKDIILTELLSASIRYRKVNIESYRDRSMDWQEIFMEAGAHQVHTLIYPTVKGFSEEIGVESAIMDKWKQSVMSCGFQMICDEVWMGEVLQILNSYGIKTIVLKGMVINKWYPCPELRTMGDSDILVREKDLEKASELLLGMGYSQKKDINTKHVEFYKDNFITIELHRLLADYSFIRNSDALNYDAWNNPMEIDIGNTKALALSWDMQAVHLLIHMASHISHGGIGLRQLCDFVIVVEKGREKIDWNIVHNKSIKYGVDHFMYAIFAVCQTLFQVEIPSVLSSEIEIANGKVELLIEDILTGGNFGKKDLKRTSANVLVNNSGGGKDQLYKNKLVNAINIIFPSRDKMAYRYKYLYVNKNPLLLPAAWMHRIAYGIIRKDYNFKHKKAIFKDDSLINMARDRN
ncbi:MAG: hypothetical protein K0R50_1521, partial [Eubacterium sp.]|nr:hypothetical protein [Eubacterium sp.]